MLEVFTFIETKLFTKLVQEHGDGPIITTRVLDVEIERDRSTDPRPH